MSWNTILQSQNNEGKEKQEVVYTSIPEGTIKIRIMEQEPYSRYTHWIPQANGGKGISVDCIGKECPICEAINKARIAKSKERPFNKTATHAINILNRTTGKHELLDKGNKIFGVLAQLNAQMGDLTKIDINITKTGRKLGDINYMVLPDFSNTPLTSQEQNTLKEELFNIRDRGLLTREQILKLMSGASLADVLVTEEMTEVTDVDTTPMGSTFGDIDLGEVI